jgi:serine/threonine-protein kinase
MLGQGSFGEVWKAWDENLHAHVVIKIMKEDLAENESLRLRFFEEARTMFSLTKRGGKWCHRITEVLDVSNQEAKIPYMVLEFVPKGNLKERLQREKPSINAALQMFLMILQGIHVAHHRILDEKPAGVIHRDIKPENILLTHSGEPKITDFGVAKAGQVMTETGVQDVESGTIVGLPTGTMGYASLEQLADSSSIGVTSDIYSLGVVLAELVAGFDPRNSCLFLEETQRTSLREVPDDIKTVIVRACNAQPEKRFQTIDELMTATEALIAAHPKKDGESAWTAREKKAEPKKETQREIYPTIAPEKESVAPVEIETKKEPTVEIMKDDRKRSGLRIWIMSGIDTRLLAPILVVAILVIVFGVLAFGPKESVIETVSAPTEVAASTEQAPIAAIEPTSNEPEIAPGPTAVPIETEEPAIARTEAESISAPIVTTAPKSEPTKAKTEAPKVEAPKVEAVAVTKVTIRNPVSSIGAEGTIKVEASIVLPEGKEIGSVTLRWKGSVDGSWKSTPFDKGKASASFKATAAMGTSVQYFVDVRLADKPGEPNRSATVIASITQ